MYNTARMMSSCINRSSSDNHINLNSSADSINVNDTIIDYSSDIDYYQRPNSDRHIGQNMIAATLQDKD